MNVQERTNREKGLEDIMEAMYSPVTRKLFTLTEGKSHDCATHVEHSKWGKGECIAENHAEPDAHGYVAWYNVIFEHGTEKVDTGDVKVLKSSHHKHMKKKKVKEGRLSRGRLANPDGTECDHCKGTGHHHDDKGNQTECKKCGGDGWIKDVVKEAPKPCPKCGKVHTINAGCGKPHSEDTSHYVNKEAGDDARHWEDPNPAADAPLTAAEALTQVKVEVDNFFSSGEATRYGAEGTKEYIFSIIDKYTPQIKP